MNWVYSDGGRARAGFKGENGDCVSRAIAIATGMPYEMVISMVDIAALEERPVTIEGVRSRSNSQTGVFSNIHKRLLATLGWEYISKDKKKTYMKAEDLPGGTVIVKLDTHLATVIDGVVHDTHDPSRRGTRRVLGYYQKKTEVGLCKGCGHRFKGERGLNAHQSKRFNTMACKKGV